VRLNSKICDVLLLLQVAALKGLFKAGKVKTKVHLYNNTYLTQLLMSDLQQHYSNARQDYIRLLRCITDD
jgi:hypothetical protein